MVPGNKENTVFGVVSRPATQNPQFVNVSPIDKTVDNESFQVERGLVKIERQKKPEVVANTNANVADEQNQPKYTILSRTPSKVAKPGSIIVPSKALVQNIEILDILAELYSGFLDHNLVVNPMTELYLIIQLITTQYTNSAQQLPSTAKKLVLKESDNDQESNCSLGDAKKNLSMLRKSLNFDMLDENDAEENVKLVEKDNLQCNNSLDKLECLALVDEKNKNLNQISTKLKQISINKTVEEKINDAKIETSSIEESDVIRDCVQMYLDTPHNCVYFSTQVLNHQKAFLKCLDRVTLKLLCENNQIATFQPELCKYLDSIYSIKVAESSKTKSLLNIG